MGLFRKKRQPEPSILPGLVTRQEQKAAQAPIMAAMKQAMQGLSKVTELLTAAKNLAASDDDVIQSEFAYLSKVWGAREIIDLGSDVDSAKDRLEAMVRKNLNAGFTSFSMATGDGTPVRGSGEGVSPAYVQLHAENASTFRPYRIVKRTDGRFALYGHSSLYQAQ